MLEITKIGLIGSGVMGEAMVKGILDKELVPADAIVASDPWQQRRDFMTNAYIVRTSEFNREAAEDADIVILSIKPQTLAKVMHDLHSAIRPDALVLSIIAGARISSLRRGLFHERIVRAMPNTPAQLGKGMTVWTATSQVTESQLEQTRRILGAFGEQLQVDEESYLDMATGLSGSGPGFVMLIIEAMVDAGVHMGFTRRDAERMVLQTIEGSVELMRTTGSHSAELRNRVTSPGGTTAAGLYELEKAAVRAILSRAIFAAYRRSQELGDLSEAKENS
ncbi:MAG: pyrroline-5-carboxylate reductase [Caldilineaceae bacterium]|nr:pyrroline-5-carboxylate reductase [Caldilineaceae bacterium]MCB9137488.1 pyrroline-5-carboxylate reductase [Caldilineaceae bacterium]